MKLELFMTTTYLKFMHNLKNQESTTKFKYNNKKKRSTHDSKNEQ